MISLMLTKTDLSQIGKILDRKLFDYPTKKDLNKHFEAIDKHFGNIEKDIKKIKKDQKTIIDFFDREYLELKARVKRIEEYLKIQPLT